MMSLQVALVAVLMVIFSRNHRTNNFQKVVGVWLFAHMAGFGQYRVLSRMGLLVLYNTVLATLRMLSLSSRTEAHQAASALNFILIWDNIN
jgi:hypothetical protein